MNRARKFRLVVAAAFVCLLVLAIGVSAAIAATATPGYAVTDFVTGFFVANSIGPVGLTFDASGNLYVADFENGFLYKFGPAGGVASATTKLNAASLGGTIAGLAFTKDGRLYLAIQSQNVVVEIDPSNGTVIRTVASVAFASGLAVDPLTGDLFVSQGAFGISRISNFASGPGTVSLYSSPGPIDGLAFGPDGLYAAIFGTGLAEIAGTNSSTPGAVILSVPVPFSDGIAVSAVPNTPFLYANRNNGLITKIDLTTNPPVLTDIVTGGSRGDFATVGSDGCLYATQSDRIVKVTNADGTCLPPPLGPLFTTGPPTVSGPSFVIGNVDAVPGNSVNFWGAQWAKLNSLSSGMAPDAFEGFAVTSPQTCGGSWTSSPGNSSNPPPTVPPYMAVIASSSVSRSGSTITGDISKIVIVRTNPGYAPAVGQAGTGTVIAVLCNH